MQSRNIPISVNQYISSIKRWSSNPSGPLKSAVSANVRTKYTSISKPVTTRNISSGKASTGRVNAANAREPNAVPPLSDVFSSIPDRTERAIRAPFFVMFSCVSDNVNRIVNEVRHLRQYPTQNTAGSRDVHCLRRSTSDARRAQSQNHALNTPFLRG